MELPNTVKYVLLYFATSSENLKLTHILFAMKYYGGGGGGGEGGIMELRDTT